LIAIACALTAARAAAADTADVVRLPDGTVFETWEKPLTFERTYRVAQQASAASDKNDGTERRPWKTISHAAEVLRPGERVIVRTGVYREWVKPARGGTGPDAMISYEAAAGEEVVLKGSDVWKPVWRKSRYMGIDGVTTWEADVSPAMFEGANAFCLQNFPSQRNTKDWKFFPGFELRRGQLFVNGAPLAQVSEFESLRNSAGSFWVEDNGMRIHVRLPGDADPQKQLFEITTREQVFAPTTPCLNYIRVKNLKMFHAANGVPIPPPQRGLLSATRGHHWIIEGCEIGYANTLGADLGGQWWSLRTGEVQGYHIVRGNYFHHCGVSAMSAWHNKANEHLLVEDNLVTDCSTMPITDHCESAGIKFHRTEHSLFRRNVVLNTPYGPGLWLDGEILNTRITQNLIANTLHPQWGAVFLEINKGPNLIDNNLILNSGGNGIYEHDAERVVSMQNLVAAGTGTAVYLRCGDPGRVNPPLENNHRVYGNVLAGFPVAINRPNPTTLSDFNLISVTNGVSPFTQFSWGAKKVKMDLAAWHAQGEDAHSQIANIAIQFDPKTLTLVITSSVPLPISFPELPEVLPGVALAEDLLTFDFLGQRRQPGRFEAGPWTRVPSVGVPFSVDPRHAR
jgi:hypothetical protein